MGLKTLESRESKTGSVIFLVERMWNIISKLGGQAPNNNKNRDKEVVKEEKGAAGALHQKLYLE